MEKDVCTRFDKVDKKFDGVDKRFDKIDKRFDALEKKIDRVIDVVVIQQQDTREMKENVRDLKQASRDMLHSIDALAKAVTDMNIEYATLRFQNERLDRWVHEVAEKVGVKLTY